MNYIEQLYITKEQNIKKVTEQNLLKETEILAMSRINNFLENKRKELDISYEQLE